MGTLLVLFKLTGIFSELEYTFQIATKHDFISPIILKYSKDIFVPNFIVLSPIQIVDNLNGFHQNQKFSCFIKSLIQSQYNIQVPFYNMTQLKETIKIIISTVLCLSFALLLVLAYSTKSSPFIFDIGFANVGLYGILLIAFFALQKTFAVLNNDYLIPKLISKSVNKPKIGIQVVGYREDPVLFRNCLISLASQDYEKVSRIVLGIDGNEEEDLKMQKTFLQIFPTGISIKLDNPYQELDQGERRNLENMIEPYDHVCISQPHIGKRQIMYTAFHMFPTDTQFICLTDSDTLFTSETVSQMVKVIDGHDQMRIQNPSLRACGAVTGNVQIWNKQNLLSYLAYLRYWYAFNVERAAQSYFGVVTCVSGPLGLYRKSALFSIKEEWLTQKFLGIKCTHGDDRNLSNLILNMGQSIYYTPFSICKTDTPAQLLRWIAQQTRWCKSFCREFTINAKCFHKQPFYLAFQLIFQFMFSIFIMITLVYHVTLSLDVYCVTLIMVTLMAIFRGIFGVVQTKRFVFLYFSFYVVVYVLFLVPSKVWGILNLYDNDWGTSERSGRKAYIIKAFHALAWAVFIVLFYVVVGIKHLLSDQQLTRPLTLYMLVICIGFLVFLFIHWGIYSRKSLLPKCLQQFKEIIKENENKIKSKLDLNQNLNQHIQNLIANAGKLKMDELEEASTYMCSEQQSQSKYGEENDWEEITKINTTTTI